MQVNTLSLKLQKTGVDVSPFPARNELHSIIPVIFEIRQSMDIEIFSAFTKGYIEEAKSFLTEKEAEYLAFSAKYITYEQVLRFLMDYIDGDNYYKIKSPEHKLARTRAQFKLLQSMEEQFNAIQQILRKYGKQDF